MKVVLPWGLTEKSILWNKDARGDYWETSEHFNILNNKALRINNEVLLSAGGLTTNLASKQIKT